MGGGKSSRPGEQEYNIYVIAVHYQQATTSTAGTSPHRRRLLAAYPQTVDYRLWTVDFYYLMNFPNTASHTGIVTTEKRWV